MSSLRQIIYEQLLNAEQPMTYGQLKFNFEPAAWRKVAASLTSLHNSALLVRSGTSRRYAYRLSDEFRERLLRRENGAATRLRRKPTNAVERNPHRVGNAPQPVWPAEPATSDIKPSLGTICCEDEEELPPVIGERYTDVMQRIGLE